MVLTEEERKQRRRDSQRKYRNSEKGKAKRKEYASTYKYTPSEEQKEKYREQAYDRYQTNKDEINEARRNKYATDEEYKNKVSERNKEYRDSNKEKLKEYKDSHKEETKEYNKNYSKTKVGRANNLLGSYRANDLKYNRGECTLTPSFIVNEIFTKSCVYCGESDWRKIGCDRKDSSLPHTEDNVVPCCLSCNSKKGSISYDEYIKMLEKEFES